MPSIKHVLIHCCLLTIMSEELVSLQELVNYTHYSRVTRLVYFLKESLIFVSFGLLFLEWPNSPKTLQIAFLEKSDCQRSVSPVTEALDLNILYVEIYVNSYLNPLFLVWYCCSLFPLRFPSSWTLCFDLIMEKTSGLQLYGWIDEWRVSSVAFSPSSCD